MPTYTYEFLDNEGNPTGKFVEEIQSIKDNPYVELKDENGNYIKVRRVVTGGVGTIFKGGGWTVNHGNRGYTGKFTKKLRDRGTPVDGPNNKPEADQQFQRWVDSGGLQGIKPTVQFDGKAQTAEQQVDKKYNPHKK
jgi:predicted nucleic acid-binding Zn ribbon protein